MYSKNEIALFKSIPGLNIEVILNMNAPKAYEYACLYAFLHNLKGENINRLRRASLHLLFKADMFRKTDEFESLIHDENSE